MQKIRNIEALRFIFAIIIVYYHIMHNNLFKLYENFSVLQNFQKASTDGCIIVELFFVISGFFLYKTFEKHKSNTVFSFALNKLFRLWFVFAFAILCCFVMSIFGLTKFNGYAEFLNLLFMQCNGISFSFKGINWYVSSFFWAILFYFVLLKTCSRNIANFLIALMTYFGYVGLVHIGFGRDVAYNFISLGVLRGLAGIGFGYLVALLIENLSNVTMNFKINRAISFISASAVEIYCFIFLMQNFVFHKISYRNPMLFVFTFAILLILFVYKKGLLSTLLDNKLSEFLGKYSYSIYVMQQVVFYILQNTLWKNESLVLNHIYICLTISIIFSVITGIIVYHLVEKPCVSFSKKWLEFNNNSTLVGG